MRSLGLFVVFSAVFFVDFSIGVSPSKYERRMNEAHALLSSSNNNAAAVKLFKEIASKWPDRRGPWVALGRLLPQEETVRIWESAVEAKKKTGWEEHPAYLMSDVEVLEEFSAALFATHQYADAEAAAELAIQESPERHRANYLGGVSAIMAKDTHTTEQNKGRGPWFMRASTRLFRAIESAKKELKEKVEEKKKNSNNMMSDLELMKTFSLFAELKKYYFSLWSCLEMIGGIKDGIKILQEYSLLDPSDSKPQSLLGDAYSQLRQHNDAQKAYEAAVTIDPKRPEFLVSVGNAQRRQKMFEKAFKSYRRALRVDPKHADAYYNWGMALDMSGRRPDAESQYAAAIKCDPRHAPALNNLAAFYSDRRQYDEAVTLYEQAIDARPDFWEAYASIGSSYKFAGRLSDAIHAMTHALTLSDTEPQLHYVLGMALKEAGRRDEAIVRISRALSLDDTNKDYFFELARLFHYKGDRDACHGLLHAMNVALGGERDADPNRWKKRGAENALDFGLRVSPARKSAANLVAPPSTPKKLKQNGVIVYLCCGNDEEFEEMTHSLTALDRHFLVRHGRYPIVVFHEGLNETSQDILTRAAAPNRLQFELVTFQFPPHLPAVDVPPYLPLAGHNWTVGYRHMSHFFSKEIYSHPALLKYDWYWRLDADSVLLDDVPADLFDYMSKNNKTYGYAAITVEAEEVVEGLFDTVQAYWRARDIKPTFLNKHMRNGEWTRNMYYTNFEVSRFDFWRSKEYNSFFNAIDKANGIYFHRWGDAPIHLLAVASLLPENATYKCADVPYWHQYFVAMPHVTDEGERITKKKKKKSGKEL